MRNGNPTLQNMPVIYSSHGGTVISTDGTQKFTIKPYRCEIMWMRSTECENIIREAWKIKHAGSPSFVLVQKLRNKRCTKTME